MARKAIKSKKPSRISRKKPMRASSVLGISADMVRAAAVILDSELAIGMSAAKAVQKRVDSERRVDAADFKDAMLRFQADARDVVNSFDAQLQGAKLDSNIELTRTFVMRAKDFIDMAVGMATTSAELANEFLQQNARAQDAAPKRKRHR